MTFDSYPKINPLSVEDVIGEITEIREDDIVTLDELNRRINSGATFSNATQSVTSATLLGENDFHIDVDCTGGAVTITFEASPREGQRHSVAKVDAGGNAVTVDGDTKNINGAATDSLAAQYDSNMYIFVAAADEWRIIASV